MAKVKCSNKICEFFSKSGCTAFEVEVSSEGLCLSATDFNSLEEEIVEEDKEDTS